MVTYEEVLNILRSYAEPEYAEFNKKIICEKNLEFIGVRMPVLRSLAKKFKGEIVTFKTFPQEFYEVEFLKLAIAAFLPYEEFITLSDWCVSLMSNWALCDCFAPSCIKKHREDFIPSIKKYLSCCEGRFEGEYSRRFALTTLLHFYVDEEYLDLIFDCISNCQPNKYYVMMGAAWLLAEVLVKHYSQGIAYLNSTMCDINIKNKAISKACDSFRISAEQKAKLKSYRRKS